MGKMKKRRKKQDESQWFWEKRKRWNKALLDRKYSYHLSADRTVQWNWNWDLGKGLVIRMRNLLYKTITSVDMDLEVRCLDKHNK